MRKTTEDKRFIEVSFPIKEVGEESVKEKYIRRGNISALHAWWARRPLASSRATNYAALIPAPRNDKDLEDKKKFIVELSKYDNINNIDLIEKARKDIIDANNGVPPKILDPFGGGGSIPLEAARIGCETYSNDYNPIAVLIQKCLLEYPEKYIKVQIKEWEKIKSKSVTNPFLEDIKIIGLEIYNLVRNELELFYPKDPDGSIPLGFIWARTLPCQNPSCKTEIPLMRQFWLAKKSNTKISLYPYVEGKNIKFKIVGTGYEKIPSGFNPAKGTISKAVVECPVCGNVIEDNLTRKLFQEGLANERMISVILQDAQKKGKKYRVAYEKDIESYNLAKSFLDEKRKKLSKEWGFDPIPDEPLPPFGSLGFRIQRYNMKTWGDIFNARQKLALITFLEKIKETQKIIKIENKYKNDYINALFINLSLVFDKLCMFSSANCTWKPTTTQVINSFVGRQAMQMTWDYFEMNPISGKSASWTNLLQLHETIFSILDTNNPVKITNVSATNLPYPDNFFDAVFTDPPYYDNVGYSNLSDFFYVWLKRLIGNENPELFATPLAPKTKEIIADPKRNGGTKQAKIFFEKTLNESFKEIYRVLKLNGISTIVYAHKTNEGWESLINSLLDSGLIITGAWPINTEMKQRLNARETASLGSSIYLITRKIERTQTGFYNDVKEELKIYLNNKLDTLWNEGIVGADFFIAAIGAGIEIFGKYGKVIDYEGNVIRADRLLENVRKIATEYAIKQILQNGFASEISKLTLFYVLWRWEFGEAKTPFDEARKLGQSVGIDISTEWGKYSFIKKDKQFIEVLNPKERKLEDLEDSDELIDVLHYCLLMWEKGNKDKILEVLTMTGFGKTDIFYRVAQAISETLPKENKEKKLLDGFLSGKEKLKKDISDKVVNKQQRLDELI